MEEVVVVDTGQYMCVFSIVLPGPHLDGIECPPVVPGGFYGAQTWVYSQH